MFIPLVREEEDLEDLYIDDFFWIHERGVDLVFIFVFIHLFRKLFLNLPEVEQEQSWKSGAFSFLILQGVVFAGLVLCCTHLSEITLTIAANALHTVFMFKGKVYWWFFTDRLLNSDTVVRLAYGHYVSAFFLAYIALVHGIDMHYDWKNENNADGLKAEMNWWEEILASELGCCLQILLCVGCLCLFLYEDPEALSYEIFMWGDVGMSTDVRFYGVAPHWYFRPYMAWLIAVPFHRLGLLGLGYFFIIIYLQPHIIGMTELGAYKSLKVIFNVTTDKELAKKYVFPWERINPELSLYFLSNFGIFLISILCALSYLPYGRFYNRLGGNFSMLVSYIYIFSYLGSTLLRYSVMILLSKVNKSN
jgi:quinol-cytochrome oxidoreductase complex cytochrome b subunit